MNPNLLEQFENPPSGLRGAPFWAWNCKLDREMLLWQIDRLAEMGMGGFTIHSRTGLDTPYLGTEFMAMVRCCVEKAKANRMKAYLYDEDRWPSGFGGGLVTKEERFRSRYLVFAPADYRQNDATSAWGGVLIDSPTISGQLLARYDIRLENGRLAEYRRLKEDEDGANVWAASLEISGESPWYNNQSYVDTLNPEATRRFIEVTHEQYAREFGEDFGGVIPSIFTDEPQFVRKSTLKRAEDRSPVVLPYTDRFEDGFMLEYGSSLLDYLPEVIWELPNGTISAVRYHYHDYVAELFARSYTDTIGAWCEQHHIDLTGHMMEEPTLHSQTSSISEAMRHYRSFQTPGIDMLCDQREYSTAKQAQSAVHQKGGREMTSELYGVTNWDFDFRGHKLQGDWQAALGVTHRVHHLSWVSMEGEAKRDYPASISYQSPWFREYRRIEEYFGRINVALTDGQPLVRVGVIHPIESYWLYFGPQDQTGAIRDELENQFQDVLRWMLFGLIDFDFLCESLLPDMSEVEGTALRVGAMHYDAVVVPGCKTLRRTTYELLEAFSRSGGTVIFMGDAPFCLDAQPSPQPAELSNRCIRIPFSRTTLLEALEPFRTVDVREQNGMRTDRYLYQMRKTDDGLWLFLANGAETENPDVPRSRRLTLSLPGKYHIVIFDAMTGARYQPETRHREGATELTVVLYDQDSLLVYATWADAAPLLTASAPESIEWKEVMRLPQPTAYTLSEPNVLLLDHAEYRLDDGEWEKDDEVLRIDNTLRRRLGYPQKLEAVAQPWTQPDAKLEHILRLRYVIASDIDVQAKLAVERPDELSVIFNGQPVPVCPDGYFTDQCIRTFPLPVIAKGTNILEITMPYSARSNLEWCYLLGDFGVCVAGDHAHIVPAQDAIAFGDWCPQGLPFYAGNVTYTCEVDLEEDEYALEASKFRAPLLSVAIDGKETGKIFLSPYQLPLGRLVGRHRIEITAYGSRINAFGQVHNCDEHTTWFGPVSWRTDGESYCREYMLRRCGILAAPRLLKSSRNA